MIVILAIGLVVALVAVTSLRIHRLDPNQTAEERRQIAIDLSRQAKMKQKAIQDLFSPRGPRPGI